MVRNIGGTRLTAWIRRGAALAAALLLAGCYESHLARRETLSIHGGDAVATNIILQTADPWPRRAWDKWIAHDGTRMVGAIDAYHDPDAGGTTAPALGGGGNGGMTTK
jgi:hypothetical protein